MTVSNYYPIATCDSKSDLVLSQKTTLRANLAKAAEVRDESLPIQEDIRRTHNLPLKKVYKPTILFYGSYYKTEEKTNLSNKFEIDYNGDFINRIVVKLNISECSLDTSSYSHKFLAFS